LRAGDRLRIVVANAENPPKELSVDIGLVAEPVISPPAAIYGLATLRPASAAVGTTLFATAPMPKVIEFPDLLHDLVAGHVRRRGQFLWSFMANNFPANAPFAYLVKVDRAGGGQLPAKQADFLFFESDR
jgi:hypothetical protein